LFTLINLVGESSAFCQKKDHLATIDARRFASYRQILLSQLGTTPFDAGRVVVCPAFESEYSISIYSVSGGGNRRAFRVTYLSPTESIWTLTDGGNDLSEIHGIRVKRIDADIPESTATVLKEVWTKMLSQARGEAPPSGKWEQIPIDSTSVEWYLQRPERHVSSGQLNNYVTRGPNTQSFLTLTAETLLRYCKSDPKERASIAHRIESDGQRLLGALSKK